MHKLQLDQRRCSDGESSPPCVKRQATRLTKRLAPKLEATATTAQLTDTLPKWARKLLKPAAWPSTLN